MSRIRLFVILLSVVTVALIPLYVRAEGIETLSWEKCLREALTGNPDIRASAESVQQAEIQKSIDRAGLYPSLSFDAGAKRYGTIGGTSSQTVQNAGASLPASSGGDDGSFSLNLSLSQLLYDGGKTRSQISSATETVKAEQFAAGTVSVDTRFTLRQAFIELLKAQEQVEIARQIVERRSQNLRLVGLRYQAGREHLGSLGKSRADEAQAKFDLQSAIRSHQTAQLRLETLLGRMNATPLRVTGSFTVATPVEKKPDFGAMASLHPSLLELTARREAARNSVDVARNQFSPKISLSSSLGNSSFDYQDMGDEGLDWQVGVNLSVPIYQGGSGRAGVAKARSVMYQFEAKEKSTRLSLARSLEERWNGLKDAIGMVAVRKQYLDAAIERARIAEAQYTSGLLSFNEWIILEDAVVSAKMSYLNAQADMLTEEARWVQAKGGTLEENR